MSELIPEPIIVPEPPKEVRPLKPLNFEESLQLLKERCGIDPEHWRQANDSVKYIEDLFVKIANKIKFINSPFGGTIFTLV